MLCGVVAGAVLPAAPDDQHPCAGGDADGVGVVLAAVTGGGVDAGGPGAGVPGAVGEIAQGIAELPADVPPEVVGDEGAGAAGGGGPAPGRAGDAAGAPAEADAGARREAGQMTNDK